MSARVVRFAAVTFGWIPLVLMLALVFLDATKYEGYRPEESELISAAVVGATVAGLVVGFVLADGRLVPVVVAVAAATVVCLLANDALYRYVIPLAGDLRGGRWGFVDVIWAPLAAAAGYGLGRLHPSVRHRRTGAEGQRAGTSRPRRLLVVAAVAGLVGVFVVPEFLRVGGELAVSRFTPNATATITGEERVTVSLAAGRHALAGYYNSRPCSLGDGIELSPPAVPLTDNSDSIVTVLLGTFELDTARSVVITCAGQPGEAFTVGDPPTFRGPLGPVVLGAPAVPLGLGLLPGLVIAGLALARRPGAPAAAV